MNTVRMLGIVALALVLQMTLAFVGGGRLAIDLVLVGVTWVGLTMGPGFGLVAGTFAGLAQDSLSSGVIGVGGLALTIVGYLAGIVGAQFIVAQMLPRFLVFLAATGARTLVVLGLDLLLGSGGGLPAVGAIGRQALGNAIVGVAVFQLVEFVPGAVERRRLDRGRVRASRLRE